jgi:acetyl esterase/lipase
VISYRLQPQNPHPAQIEDVASAFAWTVKNIRKYGGDPERVFIAGHSAGGHLVSLLGTNESFLAKHSLSVKNIRGVISISGVYDVSGMPDYFGANIQTRRDASPRNFIRTGLPPFLVAYCQWDYQTLPYQAILFHREMSKAGAFASLLYLPGQDHISEITSSTFEDDLGSRSILNFISPAGH